MSKHGTHAGPFLIVRPLVRPADDEVAELEEVLATLYLQATRQWPQVRLEPAVYVQHLAVHVPEDGAVLDSLRRMRSGDMYLALGCSYRVPVAIAALESRYLSQIPAMVARMGLSRAEIDDLQQTVRSKLLIDTEDSQAKIVDYAGRGDLHSWIRITVVRAALDMARKRRRNVPLDAIAEMAAPGDDPLLGYLKAKYGAEFKLSFASAMEQLSDRQRHILHHHVIEKLTVTQIGTIYGVHAATAARWLNTARESLVDKTKEGLKGRLGLHDDELESLLGIIRSQVDLSIERLLAPSP